MAVTGDTRIQKSYRFEEFVRQRAIAFGSQKKRDKTRDSLRLAAIRVLNNQSYLDVQVKDVCKAADVGIGTFYRNYKDISELIHELIIEFVEMFKSEVGSRNSDIGSEFSYMYHANRIYLQFARDNLGLTRCFFQVASRDDAIGLVVMDIKNGWARHVAGSVIDTAKMCSLNSSVLTTHALGSMTDDFIRRLVILKDHHLVKLCQEMKLNDDRVAEYLACIWYRVLFLKDPVELQYLEIDEVENFHFFATRCTN